MQTPKNIEPLKAGAHLHVVAPAKHITPEQVAFFKQVAEKQGFTISLSEYLFEKQGGFAGSDETRRKAVQAALDNPQVDAIVMARGGYGSSKIIDTLNWDLFLEKPKILVGFSDISVFHLHVNKHFSLPTLHAPMPLNLSESVGEAFIEQWLKTLQNSQHQLQFETYASNRNGSAKGKLIGGNLAVICHLAGTESWPDFTGKILFLEEVGETFYQVDRMMTQLTRLGVFEKVKGVIFGGFTDVEDKGNWFEHGVEEMLFEHVKHKDYPVCFQAPVGHLVKSQSLWMGVDTELVVDLAGLVIKQRF